MSEDLKPLEWVYEDDGYGVVGVSFVCPHCSHYNRFVLGDLEPHECESCHQESMPTEDAGL